jgi:hypothetical protein
MSTALLTHLLNGLLSGIGMNSMDSAGVSRYLTVPASSGARRCIARSASRRKA